MGLKLNLGCGRNRICARVLEEPYAGDLQSGKLAPESLEALLRQYNNVASEIRFKLKVIKDSA